MIRCGVLQLYPFIWAPSMGLSSGAMCLRLGDYHHDFQPSTGMGFTSIHSLSCQLANSTFFEYQGSHGVAAALLVCTIIYTHRYPFFSLICIFCDFEFLIECEISSIYTTGLLNNGHYWYPLPNIFQSNRPPVKREPKSAALFSNSRR